MLNWRVLTWLLNLLVIFGLLAVGKHYYTKSVLLKESNNALEAQISSLLNDHNKYADMYRDVSNRLNIARILALEGTLRLDNIVIESEPDSELDNWSRAKIPEEVKSVLTDMREALGGSYER